MAGHRTIDLGTLLALRRDGTPVPPKSIIITFDDGFRDAAVFAGPVMSTAACVSKITYIDGDKGELLYRGYPIEQLAVQCDFLEVCYLLLKGELPNATQKADFVGNVTQHTMVHEQMSQFFRGFRRDSHPMAMLVGVVGSLSAFYHDSLDITDAHHRHEGPRGRSLPYGHR